MKSALIPLLILTLHLIKTDLLNFWSRRQLSSDGGPQLLKVINFGEFTGVLR
jgi:hypothetical protein